MNRFFGMMPSDCVKKEQSFVFGGVDLTIQAGETGWTILYGDGSSEYEDVEGTVENNFNRAYLIVCENFNSLEEI